MTTWLRRLVCGAAGASMLVALFSAVGARLRTAIAPHGRVAGSSLFRSAWSSPCVHWPPQLRADRSA